MSIMNPYIISRRNIKSKRKYNNILNPMPNSRTYNLYT